MRAETFAFREYRSSPLDELTESRRRGSRGGGGRGGVRRRGGRRASGGSEEGWWGRDGNGGVAGRRGWQTGRRVREKEGEKERGGRKAVRRRKEGFGRRPGSLGCLWSRHAACAVFSARLTLPACYGDGDAGRGVNASTWKGEEIRRGRAQPVSRA